MQKIIAVLLLMSLPLFAGPQRHPIYEPSVSQNKDATVSVLGNAKITASGHWGDQLPELAIDGKQNNPNAHWACETLPAILDLELKTPTPLSAVRVWPFWTDGRIYQYKVEGSLDNQTWEILGDQSANSISATAAGDIFNFSAKTVRYLRLTVLDSSKPASGAHIVEIAAYADEVADGLQGGVGSINTRYSQTERGQLAPAADGIKLTAWRGERANAQVVTFASKIQKQLRVEPLQLRSAAAGAAPITAQINFVRYVLSNGKPLGDILDTETMLEQPAGMYRPVWIAIDVPCDALPGTYTGTLTVRSELGALDFPVELNVLSATLPLPKDWAFHLDIWQHPHAVARWHDVKLWSPEHFAIMKPLMKRLADAGQKNITCSIIHEPWGKQTFDWIPSMIQWQKNTDGSWSFDYTDFDKWVEFMMNDVGITGQIVCYTMIPWSLKFRYYDEATHTFIDQRLQPGSSQYDEHWGRFFRDFLVHLKAKNWLEKTAIGIDERPDNLLRPTIAALQKHAPELRIVSAVNKPSELTKDVYDLSPLIDVVASVSPDLLAKRRADGRRTTYYVCCHPPVPNTFTFSPPAESAWLPLLSVAKGYDGFLRWAYNSWVANPLSSTDFTSWPSGDCFLVYPGNRSSLRWERLRDGIEEVEKIRILRSQNNATINATIDQMLKGFTLKRAKQRGAHDADVTNAAKIIEELSGK